MKTAPEHAFFAPRLHPFADGFFGRLKNRYFHYTRIVKEAQCPAFLFRAFPIKKPRFPHPVSYTRKDSPCVLPRFLFSPVSKRCSSFFLLPRLPPVPQSGTEHGSLRAMPSSRSGPAAQRSPCSPLLFPYQKRCSSLSLFPPLSLFRIAEQSMGV